MGHQKNYHLDVWDEVFVKINNVWWIRDCVFEIEC